MAQETSTPPENAPSGNESQGVDEQGNLTEAELMQSFGAQELEREQQEQSQESEESGTESTSEEESGSEGVPPESESEESEQSTESENQESEEASEDETVLSQEEEQGLSEQAKKKVKSRIGKLTARTKSAEEAQQAMQQEVQQLKQQMERLQQAPKEDSAQDSTKKTLEDRIQSAEKLEDLQVIYDQAQQAKKWARKNMDKEEVEVDENTVLTRDQINSMLDAAEDALERHIPQRAQFLQSKTQADQAAFEAFPAWKDSNSDDHQRLQALWNEELPGAGKVFQKTPNGRYLAGVMLEGIKALEAKRSNQGEGEGKQTAKKTAANKQGGKAPKVPGMESETAPPSNTREAEPSEKEKQFQNASRVSQDDLVELLAEQESKRSKQKK